MANLDFDKQPGFIIPKIFEYGSFDDMIAITRYYGEDLVKKTLIETPFFYPDTIYLSVQYLKSVRRKWHVAHANRISVIPGANTRTDASFVLNLK